MHIKIHINITNITNQLNINTRMTEMFHIFRSECSSIRPTSPQSFKDSIYGSLPRSMKEQQLLVKSKVEDPEKQKERQELVRTKSPAELSQISGVADLPIPTPVENLLKRKR